MLPLVTAIMPIYNRREFAECALKCYYAQTYPNKELVIVEDGPDDIRDLITDWTGVKYVRLDEKHSVGAKRNIACQHARGEYIVHWDSDDWSAPGRIAEQHKLLTKAQVAFVGYGSMLFIDEARRIAWLYSGEPNYALGTSFFYSKTYWRCHKFPDISEGEDNAFVESAQYLVAVDAGDRMVARIHANNTSEKHITPEMSHWQRVDYVTVAALIA